MPPCTGTPHAQEWDAGTRSLHWPDRDRPNSARPTPPAAAGIRPPAEDQSLPAAAAPAPTSPGFRRLAVVTTALTLVLIALGGAVRATDSGLACPTWPGCFSGGDFLPPAGLNVWLEHSHRLVAGGVGLLVAALGVWALARYRSRADIVWPAVAAGVAVVVQALLGAFVVWLQLRAELVTAHLGLGMAVVGCLLFLSVAATRPRRARPADDDRRLARASLAVAGLTYAQILVGGHVTGLGAGLAFVPGFPWLGLVAFGPVVSEGDAYNVVHRLLAGLLVVAVGLLVWTARQVRAAGWQRRLPWVAAVLVGVQVLLGVANLANGLSWVSVIPHLAVASWIWAVLVVLTTLAYRDPPPAGAAVPASDPGRTLAGTAR